MRQEQRLLKLTLYSSTHNFEIIFPVFPYTADNV